MSNSHQIVGIETVEIVSVKLTMTDYLVLAREYFILPLGKMYQIMFKRRQETEQL